ncbi:unnamed protein product [Brassica oleracea var. botrytis]
MHLLFLLFFFICFKLSCVAEIFLFSRDRYLSCQIWITYVL